MSKSAEIKEALEKTILEKLQEGESSSPFLAVARQFLKDFPPEGAPIGADATGVLGSYAKKIDKLGLRDVAKPTE